MSVIYEEHYPDGRIVRRKRKRPVRSAERKEQQNSPEEKAQAEMNTPKEESDLKRIIKHPISKVVLGVGGVLVSMYLLSYFFDAGTKLAASYHKFKLASQGPGGVEQP